jgi:hypothetical protein
LARVPAHLLMVAAVDLVKDEIRPQALDVHRARERLPAVVE